jgi:hypothetical protein
MEEFVEDLRLRIQHYKDTYETMGTYGHDLSIIFCLNVRQNQYFTIRDCWEKTDEKENLPFIKILDGGRQIVINQVHGYMQSRIIQFLVNVRFTGQSTFYFTRHGQSEVRVILR